MNKELMEALDTLEKEKGISKSALIEAIGQSLVQACKQHFGKSVMIPKIVVHHIEGMDT